jgi:hypothetical protein
VTLKNFSFKTQRDLSKPTDPTLKFTLAKKEQKAGDLLMNLNFISDDLPHGKSLESRI